MCNYKNVVYGFMRPAITESGCCWEPSSWQPISNVVVHISGGALWCHNLQEFPVFYYVFFCWHLSSLPRIMNYAKWCPLNCLNLLRSSFNVETRKRLMNLKSLFNVSPGENTVHTMWKVTLNYQNYGTLTTCSWAQQHSC